MMPHIREEISEIQAGLITQSSKLSLVHEYLFRIAEGCPISYDVIMGFYEIIREVQEHIHDAQNKLDEILSANKGTSVDCQQAASPAPTPSDTNQRQSEIAEESKLIKADALLSILDRELLSLSGLNPPESPEGRGADLVELVRAARAIINDTNVAPEVAGGAA